MLRITWNEKWSFALLLLLSTVRGYAFPMTNYISIPDLNGLATQAVDLPTLFSTDLQPTQTLGNIPISGATRSVLGFPDASLNTVNNLGFNMLTPSNTLGINPLQTAVRSAGLNTDFTGVDSSLTGMLDTLPVVQTSDQPLLNVRGWNNKYHSHSDVLNFLPGSSAIGTRSAVLPLNNLNPLGTGLQPLGRAGTGDALPSATRSVSVTTPTVTTRSIRTSVLPSTVQSGTDVSLPIQRPIIVYALPLKKKYKPKKYRKKKYYIEDDYEPYDYGYESYEDYYYPRQEYYRPYYGYADQFVKHYGGLKFKYKKKRHYGYKNPYYYFSEYD